MVDRVEIIVRGGCGGDGLISFRHEKYIPFGGPDGGDGGSGGSVFIIANPGVDDLGLLKQKRKFVAENGAQGGSGQRCGKKGEVLTISVPVGTMVSVKSSESLTLCHSERSEEAHRSGQASRSKNLTQDKLREETQKEILIADLTTVGQKVLVVKGGRGGLGNAHFATAVNQAPEIASKGELGEERYIILELRLITDICIIGYPNAGKSTLLSAISRAKPQIADYPFTTRQPILGVMQDNKRDFVVAEIPGIVEGAYGGRGLGNEFLRHVERTKLLIYLLDGTSPTIVDDLSNLAKELALYKVDLSQKPKIVAVNKTDLPQVQVRLPDIEREFNKLEVPIFYISAISGQGVTELAGKAMEMVEQARQEVIVSVGEGTSPSPTFTIFHPRPKR